MSVAEQHVGKPAVSLKDADFNWEDPLDLEGELTEEIFRAPGALLEPLGTKVIRAGELAELDLGGPIYHRVSNRTRQPLVTLHVYGVAADKLTTGINRIYAGE